MVVHNLDAKLGGKALEGMLGVKCLGGGKIRYHQVYNLASILLVS